MQPRLRVFVGDDLESKRVQPEISVTLSELAELLVEAQLSRRAWIQDLADEPLLITGDLHEVILTYRRLGKSA